MNEVSPVILVENRSLPFAKLLDGTSKRPVNHWSAGVELGDTNRGPKA